MHVTLAKMAENSLKLVSAPDHTQAKSGLATRAKFLGLEDVSFWNAGIPIKSVLAQLVTCKSHDIVGNYECQIYQALYQEYHL